MDERGNVRTQACGRLMLIIWPRSHRISPRRDEGISTARVQSARCRHSRKNKYPWASRWPTSSGTLAAGCAALRSAGPTACREEPRNAIA